MKFFVHVKPFILAHKVFAASIAAIFLVIVSSIIYVSNNTKIDVVGQDSASTQASDNTSEKKLGFAAIDTKNSVTKGVQKPTPTKAPSKVNTPSPTTIKTTVVATSTPVPPTPTNAPPQAGSYVLNGVTFSSQYPTVSLKPGEKKTLFTMTASGNKNFVVNDFRLIGSNGLGLSEMSGNLSDGQTKEILLAANPDATPGTYSGFIGVKIDGASYQQPLRPTVIIEGAGSGNASSLNLTGPAAGSVYNSGDTIVITWEASNISGDFSLSVEGNNGDTYSFANVSNSQRSYSWNAQKWFAPNATHFRFTISGGSLLDHSDGDIIIN